MSIEIFAGIEEAAPKMTRQEAEALLEKVLPLIDSRYAVAGSYRRGAEFVGDLDIVVMAGPWQETFPYELKECLTYEDSLGVCFEIDGRKVDLFIAETEDQWGGLLAFATGPREHGRRIDNNANKLEIWRTPATNELDFFAALGLEWVFPCDRNFPRVLRENVPVKHATLVEDFPEETL